MNYKLNIRKIYWLLGLLLLAGCTAISPIKELFRKASPHEKYKSFIEAAGLETTALGKDWEEAAEKALYDSIKITLPFRETIYFPADKPKSVGYKFSARRGEKIVITSTVNSRVPVKLFIDLFEAGKVIKNVAWADSGIVFKYKVKKNHTFLLRLQPELLRSCQLMLTIENKPSLTFPVHGKDGKAIISIFGDSRDRGKRKHEGIDIAAKKGTPVLAGSNGYISSVRENNLGGKVVYLTDPELNKTFYYAHLDSQIVTIGQPVKEGDIIGTVGNTGNARNTEPHLHFGIYDLFDGAIDPYPYVHQNKGKIPALMNNPEKIDQSVRTKANAALYLSPAKKSDLIMDLQDNTFCQIIGGVDGWLHIQLPDGNHGYIQEQKLESIDKPYAYYAIKSATPLYDETYANAAVSDTLKEAEQIPLFARFNSFLFTVNSKGQKGWILIP